MINQVVFVLSLGVFITPFRFVSSAALLSTFGNMIGPSASTRAIQADVKLKSGLFDLDDDDDK